MKTFEYDFEYDAVAGGDAIMSATENLNRRGANGWELVAIIESDYRPFLIFYFKREIVKSVGREDGG